VTAADFELGAHLLLSPGTCARIPDAPLQVSELGLGLMVTATLMSDIAASPRMKLFVNDIDMGTTSGVSNGDKVQIELCTPASY